MAAFQAGDGLLQRQVVGVDGAVDRAGIGGSQFRRQIGAVDGIGTMEDHDLFHGVFQLAHVARPRVVLQYFQSSGAQLRLWSLFAAGDAPEKMVAQRRDIFTALAQWRQFQFHHRQAVVEIFAKGAVGHGLF